MWRKDWPDILSVFPLALWENLVFGCFPRHWVNSGGRVIGRGNWEGIILLSARTEAPLLHHINAEVANVIIKQVLVVAWRITNYDHFEMWMERRRRGIFLLSSHTASLVEEFSRNGTMRREEIAVQRFTKDEHRKIWKGIILLSI